MTTNDMERRLLEDADARRPLSAARYGSEIERARRLQCTLASAGRLHLLRGEHRITLAGAARLLRLRNGPGSSRIAA